MKILNIELILFYSNYSIIYIVKERILYFMKFTRRYKNNSFIQYNNKKSTNVLSFFDFKK